MQENKKPNKLMIVAHPDDESLFGGAQLILEDEWKVICVTNGDCPIRRAEFESVMYITNSRFEMWDYPDKMYSPFDENELKPDLERVINERKWSKILTHNALGEYGHPHHKQIHLLMRKLVPDLWTFDYSKSVLLPDDIWEAKLGLIEMYESLIS